MDMLVRRAESPDLLGFAQADLSGHEIEHVKSHLLYGIPTPRYTTAKKVGSKAKGLDQMEAATKMRVGLIVLIGRYHSHVVPNLAKQASLAASFRRPDAS